MTLKYLLSPTQGARMDDSIRLTVTDHIAHVELSRPQRSNAFDLAAARALDQAVQTIGEDDSIDVVLLTGSGPRFCAGGDLSSVVGAADIGAYLGELGGAL